MARPRACDACSLRKVRCTGRPPCPNCTKTGFKCSFAKRPRKSGPKGPRRTTLARISDQIQSLDAESSEGPSVVHSTASHADDPVASNFTSSDVFAYLEIYQHRMYPVWPVIDVARLRTALETAENSHCETWALALAVCAGTCAQLRLEEAKSTALADQFAAESERYRSKYDYRESSTIESILIPLFLHFYYGAKGKRQTASFLLRETVSMCQLLALDNEDTYQDFASEEEESYRRRTFWLLYVTERGHAMQHGTPVCLTKSIALASSSSGKNHSHDLQAFHTLTHLFASVDGVLVGSEAANKNYSQQFGREMLVQIQRKLQHYGECPTAWNEVQRSDVSITQQWLRMLIWQLSLSTVALSSKQGDDSMSFTYPAHVSRDALRSISTVSFDALVTHGRGMQMKIRDITNTLLDVMTCVHSLPPEMFLQTRQTLHELCCYLARLNGNRGEDWDCIRKRLIESNFLLEPVSELHEITEISNNGDEATNDNQGLVHVLQSHSYGLW